MIKNSILLADGRTSILRYSDPKGGMTHRYLQHFEGGGFSTPVVKLVSYDMGKTFAEFTGSHILRKTAFDATALAAKYPTQEFMAIVHRAYLISKRL